MNRMEVAFAWGRWGETVLGEYLKSQGWQIIRLGDIKTAHGGPRAEGENTSTVLLDLMRIKDGITRFVEVKVKDSPVVWRDRKEYREGIDLPYWRDYLKVQSESGIQGDLAIIEVARTEDESRNKNYRPRVLFQSLTKLIPYTHETAPHPEVNQPHGMAYWPISAFEVLLDDFRIFPPSVLGETLKSRLHGWHQHQVKLYFNRTCTIPLSGEKGKPLYERDESHLPILERTSPRLKCGKSVVSPSPVALCREHYAPISDDAIALYISKRLGA